MKIITEESGEHKKWYEEAEKVKNTKELSKFITRLTTEYQYDYGTICHAIAAAALAAAYTVNRAECGGITGFQAGAVMWEFIRKWNGLNGPARLLKFENLLYPQYVEGFQKITLTEDTAKWLKEEAVKLLADKNYVSPAVIEHWEKLASGWLPLAVEVSNRN